MKLVEQGKVELDRPICEISAAVHHAQTHRYVRLLCATV